MAQADEARRYFSQAQEVFRIVKVGLFVRLYLMVLTGHFLYHRELSTKKQSNLRAKAMPDLPCRKGAWEILYKKFGASCTCAPPLSTVRSILPALMSDRFKPCIIWGLRSYDFRVG